MRSFYGTHCGLLPTPTLRRYYIEPSLNRRNTHYWTSSTPVFRSPTQACIYFIEEERAQALLYFHCFRLTYARVCPLLFLVFLLFDALPDVNPLGCPRNENRFLRGCPRFSNTAGRFSTVLMAGCGDIKVRLLLGCLMI